MVQSKTTTASAAATSDSCLSLSIDVNLNPGQFSAATNSNFIVFVHTLNNYPHFYLSAL